MRLSKKVSIIRESLLNRWDTDVKKRIASGEDILQFNLGQPDFACPDFVRQAIREAASSEKNNFYANTAGTTGLRRAIASLERREFGLEYGEDEIIVTNGAKESIFLALAAAIDPGDEVVIIAPAWPAYVEDIRFLEGVPVVIGSDQDFRPDIGAIKSAISGRTKAIIVNSPNNPTGVVYTEQELEAIAQIAKVNDLIVISDEIYGATVYDEKHLSIAGLPDMRSRTVVIDSFSKTLSIAGYRLGYASSSREIIDAMIKVKSNINGNTSSLVMGAVELIIDRWGDELDSFIDGSRQEYLKRRDLVCAALSDMGVERVLPSGAFYVFAKIPEKLDRKSGDFAKYLVEKAGVSVAPGIFFGSDYDGFFRISFSASMEDLQKGMERMKKVL